MESGVILATKWFAQRMEWALLRPTLWRWDYEKNDDIFSTLRTRVEKLYDAMEVESGILDACVGVAVCCLAIAHNVEAGKGKEDTRSKHVIPVKEPEKELTRVTPASARSTTPLKKRGRPRG